MTMALSGFSPKTEVILKPRAACAQEAKDRWEKNMEKMYKLGEIHGARSKVFVRICESYLEDLKSGDAPRQINAMESLWYPCTAATNFTNRAYSGVIRALKDRNLKVRAKASEVLVHILDDSLHDVYGMRIVEHPGLFFRDAIFPLLGALDDPRGGIGMNAARGIGKIGVDAVDTLIGALDSKDWKMRKRAAYMLGTILDSDTYRVDERYFSDSNVDNSVPKLRKMSQSDPNEDVRRAAASAVESITK